MTNYPNLFIDSIWQCFTPKPAPAPFDVYLPDGRIAKVLALTHLHACVGMVLYQFQQGQDLSDGQRIPDNKIKIDVTAEMPDGQIVKTTFDYPEVRGIIEVISHMLNGTHEPVVKHWSFEGFRLA